MAKEQYYDDESRQLTGADNQDQVARNSVDSVSSISTTSIVLERLNRQPHDTITSNDSANRKLLGEEHHSRDFEKDVDLEDSVYDQLRSKPFDKKARCLIWLIGSVLVGAWILTLIILLLHQTYKHSSSIPHDPAATATRGSGKKVTMDQIFSGQWRPNTHDISWIPGADGEDGLLLERLPGRGDKDYLIVEDVRRSNASAQVTASKTLMKGEGFQYGSNWVFPSNVWPSRDQKSVLLSSEQQKDWRHSSTAKYWIFDVATQTGQPLDPDSPDSRIQLATWSPTSDHIAFTRDNNLFVRSLSSSTVTQITTDGGIDLFYGVPDWVYEEEVFSSNVATWWSGDGKFIAFLRTNESTVPEYPIEYFVSRPSGDTPPPGEENYPETREIKYPKAGAPNPLVDLQFYDIEAGKTFSVDISEDFPGNDRLITEVVWAGASGKVLIRETNRESDILQVVVIDTTTRSGTVVRKVDVNTLDGGWFEVSQSTRYIPADAAKNRPQDGYIDTVIHDGYDHLAYFTPIESSEPIILTSGNWEVVDAPSAIDLKNNLVYFVGTKEGPTQRHVYSVRLDGSSLKAVTDISEEGYYSASFSSGAGYALLSYAGPKIPWQKVMSTPGNDDYFEDIIEDNKHLASFASQYELPLLVYQNVTVDGYTLQVVERRPPHFNPKRKYPVLFYLYGGPGSQMVDKKFNVDFQAYIASGLGYIVVTVDGRGTGFIGRKARCIIRGNLGYYESKDQIATAKIWAEKDYVDESRLAIWGWSYGGFMTLKTLEQDAGNTFHYGMAVAPVTDWRFYDSIYTERYMHTPQHNADGYNNASISDVTALQNNVRFLVMHGVADDNVHLQNTLTLLDKLDLAGIENYDVHFFPDSDHNIYFHNANRMVYDRLNDWLINAFNGEWLKTVHPSPSTTVDVPSKSR